jgi:hypothetical protein
MNILVEKHFWMTYNKHNCGRYYNHLLGMEGCGTDKKWQIGSANYWDTP